MSEKKYFKANDLKITQYDGSETLGTAIVDESKSVVAVAVARPGNTGYRQSAQSNNQSRVLMMGDIAIYSFKYIGEHKDEKTEETHLEGEIGTEIMSTKTFMVLQTKLTDGTEREPFVRTPWDVRQTTQNQGNMEPPTFSQNLKLLADEAINQAGETLAGKIERGENIRAQSEYARLASSAARMAKKLTNQRTTQQSQQNDQPNQGAVTATDLLGI